MMTKGDDNTDPQPSGKPLRAVPIAWEALEDAFENNAPEVHSYLHLENGEVIRIVDGIADPGMHQRVMGDAQYLRVEPVSSREQYRWMERFIATVDEGDLRDKLVASIDGKGAFRRFKDVLMSFPIDRERWFTFRSERLRACMETWLATHGIEAVARPDWHVPTADEVSTPETAVDPAAASDVKAPAKKTRAQVAETLRKRATELVEALPARELDAAVAFLEFLRERKHLPRAKVREGDEPAEHPLAAPVVDAPKADA
jgi:hypothetical protein